jgi:hypothetical protein
LIKVSVREVPSVRRFRMFRPALRTELVEFCWLVPTPTCGSWLSRSETLMPPVARSDSPVATVSGVGALAPLRRRREPVTTISSVGPDCWALASPANASEATPASNSARTARGSNT